MSYKKGFTLFSALLMVLVVSLIMAVIGMIFLKSTKIEYSVKVFKTTRDAAESTAYAVINSIQSGDLKASCNPGCGNNAGEKCPIELPPDIEQAIEQSGLKDVEAYLLSNCTDPTTGSQIYTIQVEAEGGNGTKTIIYFIYEK